MATIGSAGLQRGPICRVGRSSQHRKVRDALLGGEFAERRSFAPQEPGERDPIAAHARSRDAGERPNPTHRPIVERPSCEDQTQGDEGFIGRSHADRFERAIEWRRSRIVGTIREQRCDDLGLGDRVPEKVAIDDFEPHRMRFAAGVLSVSFATLGGSAIAALPAQTTPGTSLDALLERARHASGSPYRYHVVSHSHEARQGRVLDVTTDSEGVKYRTRTCSKTLCSGSYFDGERNFDTNINDTALPRATGADGLPASLRAIVSYAFTAPDFRASGGRIVEREAVRREGRTYRRLSIVPLHGTLLDALVDPATGLIGAVVSDERKYVFDLKDQRPVDAKLILPFSISLNGSEIERFASRAIANVPLEAPPGLIPTIAPNAAPLAMTKLERASDQPVVPCAIGGQTATCLLDTGNSGLSMSLEFAEKLGLEPHGRAFDISGVGRYVTGIVEAPALTVGPATYPPARYVVLHDLHQYGYDVVLGTDVFARARITLAYGRRTVTFAPESAAGAAGGGIALAFENFVPTLPLRIDEHVVTLAVDTGDESTINLAYEYYEAHPALFKPSGTVAVAGIGGASDELTGELTHLRVGDYDVLRPRIGATRRMPATARGHIGSGLLRHFDVTFDYRRSRLELAPRADDASVHTVP